LRNVGSPKRRRFVRTRSGRKSEVILTAIDERESVCLVQNSDGGTQIRGTSSITDLIASPKSRRHGRRRKKSKKRRPSSFQKKKKKITIPPTVVHVMFKKLTYDFEVDIDDKCEALFIEIGKRFRIKNRKNIRLTCMCRELKENRRMRRYGVTDGALIYLYVKGGSKSYNIPSEIRLKEGRPISPSLEASAGSTPLSTDSSSNSLAPDIMDYDRSNSCDSDASWLSTNDFVDTPDMSDIGARSRPSVILDHGISSSSSQIDMSSPTSSDPTMHFPPTNTLINQDTKSLKITLNDQSLYNLGTSSGVPTSPCPNLPEKKRWHRTDFETIAVIGRGAFGEVRVVVPKGQDGPMYAMKCIPKKKIRESRWKDHMTRERDLLASQNTWLVNLYLSFQDKRALFLLMEFCAGGDFLSLLRTHHKLEESTTVFYMTELTLAIHAVHEMGYVHRDLKPDNILLDSDGHIKLSDFGLAGSIQDGSATMEHIREVAKNVDTSEYVKPQTHAPVNMKRYQETRREMLFSMVGTPDYMAPEVLRGKGYGKECDWWSLGVITFECLMGYPPFWSESKEETCKNIIQYTQTFRFPKKAKVSWTAKDFIFRLICVRKRRMGFDRIKGHKFFAKTDWKNIRSQEPPIPVHIDEDNAGKNFDEVTPDADFASQDIGSSGVSEGGGEMNIEDVKSGGDEENNDHYQNWTMRNPVGPEFYKNNRLMYRRRSERPELLGIEPWDDETPRRDAMKDPASIVPINSAPVE